jgi:deoxyribodipyrimidine photo-lyase
MGRIFVTAPVIVWFRRNLRLMDNDALRAAADTGQPLLPVFIHDSNDAGAASDWWLHYSLGSLSADLARLDTPLLVLSGSAADLIPRLAHESGAARLYFANGYTALASAEQDAVTAGLPIDFQAFDDYYLHAPGTVKTGDDTPYRVFTPFWKACQALGEPRRPGPAPERLRPCPAGVRERLQRSLPAYRIEELALLPRTPDWSGGLRSTWQPGEAGGLSHLESFGSRVHEYTDRRDRPDLDATSRLSPHLHFGEISVRQVWHHVNDVAQLERRSSGADAWLRQLYWRDFSGHLLYHFPELPAVPLRREYERFPWALDDDNLHAWQKGRTGYPIIDAGMRELWSTGWMHNSVRMIAASFLVK